MFNLPIKPATKKDKVKGWINLPTTNIIGPKIKVDLESEKWYIFQVYTHPVYF